MTQKDWVKLQLINGRFLTPRDAIVERGIYRLGARINELRKEGMPIVTQINKNGAHYARYYLRERRAAPRISFS